MIRAMKKDERRSRILLLLQQSSEPVSGSRMAELFGVSRQVIVSDIRALRKQTEIDSLSHGYYCPHKYVSRVIHVSHGADEIEEELNCIVDHGCSITDVKILHPLYGWMSAELKISTRRDVKKFVEKVTGEKITPLTALTEGDHYHTVFGKTSQDLDEMCAALARLNILREDPDT